MSLTDAQVVTKIRRRGFPDDLGDDEVVEAIASWLEVARARRPTSTLGTFDTTAGQSEYDLFGTGGPLAGGFEVQELYGHPTGDGPELDVFGVTPWLQDLGLVPPFDHDNYTFNVPGDFLINDRVWSAFRERFGAVRFTVKESRLGSPIRLDPPPRDTRTLLVRYTRPRSDSELREDDAVLLAGTEWQCLEFLARKYALSAGVTIGAHEDSGGTAKLFRAMADKAETRALTLLDNRFLIVFVAATRS